MNDLTLDKLKQMEVISIEHVTTLKKYIREKYRGTTEAHHAGVFADAVRKTVDKHLAQFADSERGLLRKRIIEDAVQKPAFSVDGLDYFRAFAAQKDRNDKYVDSICLWMEQNINERPDPKELGMVLDQMGDRNITDVLINSDSPMPSEVSVTTEVAAADKIYEPVEIAIDEIPIPKERAAITFPLPLIKPIAIAAIFTLLFFSSIWGVKVETMSPNTSLSDAAGEWVDRYPSLEEKVIDKLQSRGESVTKVPLVDGLPENLHYAIVDRKALKAYLDKRNSLVGEEPYLSAIYAVAKQYDVNPLLLVAITGQEQGFVPKSSPYARKIINNPFNVYGSWETYNTDIMDSACLAAETVVNACKQRPAYMNSIRWINRRYAEDENWWKGVYTLFLELKKATLDNGGKI